MNIETTTNRFPAHGYLGIGLIIIFWYLNWSLNGLRTQWGFFPLWLGYCLTVDALVFFRRGSSMLKRSFLKYISLFLISAPCWWLFELFNHVLQNWKYIGKEYFSDFEYFLLASLSFSTVMPAVFGTSELAATFKWIRNSDRSVKSSRIFRILGFSGLSKYPGRRTLLICFVLGWVFLFMLLIWPEYFFYLVWIAVYLIIDPTNYLMNKSSLLNYIIKGNWRPVLSLWTGVIICAFFWEMWNYYSYPKWVYYLPIADFLHVFEMPVLGYIGYIPFSMELFALYNLIAGSKRSSPLFIMDL